MKKYSRKEQNYTNICTLTWKNYFRIHAGQFRQYLIQIPRKSGSTFRMPSENVWKKPKACSSRIKKESCIILRVQSDAVCALLDRLELRIDALDDGFYLDTQEASAHYHADFLQDRFLQDLIFLYEKAAEKFIRIQHFEQVQIRQNYAEYYDALLFQMIKALTGLILETVEESEVHAAGSLRIICGDYMDHAVILY